MEFNPLDFQRVDASGQLVLDEEYIFSYTYRDGWTERLLSFRLFIDIYYVCWGKMSFHTTGKERKRIEKVLNFELPSEIKKIIDLMINKNELNLKKYYLDWFLEDSKDAHFVINHNGISNNVGIGIMLEKLQDPNESEKLFFLLEEEIKKLQEDLYIKILEEQKNVLKEDINPKRKKRH